MPSYAKIQCWLICLAPALGSAHTVDEIQSLRERNDSGVIINWSAPRNPEYDNYAILPLATVFFQTDGRTEMTYEYQIVFRLLDDRRNAVMIFDDLGQPGEAFVITDTITLPAARTANSLTRAYQPPKLQPSGVQLDPSKTYTIELSLKKRMGRSDPFVATGDVSVSAGKQYFHFPGLVTPDAAFNVLATLDDVDWTRTYLVKTVPGKDTFRAEVDYTLQRFDDPLEPVKTDNIPVQLNYELRDSADNPVALKANQAIFLEPMASYLTTANPNLNKPNFQTFTRTVAIEPADNIQLDSVNQTYTLIVSIAHLDEPGQPPVAGNNITLGAEQLLHFNGHLFFGPIDTIFTSIANDPLPIMINPTGVESTLQVDNQSGYVAGMPGYTYGDNTVLPVVLDANGNAHYTSLAPVTLNGPMPDNQMAGCIEFSRSNVTLSSDGATGDFKVKLPTGFGYRAQLNSRLLKSRADFTQVALNQNLMPLANPVLSGTLFACEESKPFWILASAMEWNVGLAQFVLTPTGIQYVRHTELADLENAPGLVEPDMDLKRSNEQHFRFVDGVAGLVTVSTDAACNARMTLDLTFGPGEFVTHFPYDTELQWTGGGTMSINNDLVLPGQSSLTQVAPFSVPYSRDCFEPDCAPDAGPAYVPVFPNNNELRFTVDGGLHGAGTITTGESLNWGWIGTIGHYAHRTEPVSATALHVPGCFLRGDQLNHQVPPQAQPLSPADGPGVILLSGVVASDLSVIERPESPAYNAHNVAGDYAGLNFVVGALSPAFQGESYLAALPTGEYSLRSRCKYYTRFAGVSGVHEAVDGTFKPDAKLYNYDFEISNFSLAFQGSQNVDSRTEGSISLPWPSLFVQDFKELKFHCNGALQDAQVPPGDPKKDLDYWKGDFTTAAIRFVHDPNLDCDPSKGFLVLGVSAWVSHVEPLLHGEVGFRPNGRIIHPAFADAENIPVTSRLEPPNNLTFSGPGDEKYHLTAVYPAYYNNYDDYPSADTPQGFMNLAGRVNVPFFEDLQAHVQITGGRMDSSEGSIYLSGGWPNEGWKDGNGEHYFSQSNAGFDPNNTGFPVADATPKQYRREVKLPGLSDEQDLTSEKFLVRARRDWVDTVAFDYGLRWSFLTRSFRGMVEDTDVLVLHLHHEPKYLSAENLEMTFGAQYDGVPSINIANLVFDQVSGTADVVKNALGVAIAEPIQKGLGTLDDLLDAQSHDFFEKPFDDLFAAQIEQLYNALKNAYAAQPWQPDPIIHAHAVTETESFLKQFENNLTGVIAPAPAGFGVLNELNNDLAQISDAIQKVQDILAETGNGHRTHVISLVDGLLGKFAGSVANSIIGAEIDAGLMKADASLDAIFAALTLLQDAVDDAKAALNGGEWHEELIDLRQALAASGVFSDFMPKVEKDIENLLDPLKPGIDHFSTALPLAQFKQEVRQSLEDHFFGSTAASQIQALFKKRLYELDASIRQSIDGVFQQANAVMRDLVAAALAEVDHSFTEALGLVGPNLGAAKMNGYAQIKGDSLSLLRIDLETQLDFAGKLEFGAFLQIKELDSEGSPGPCSPEPGEKWTEVTMGATDVKLEWLGDLTVGVETKFTFDQGEPINFMGKMDLEGGLKFETFEIKEVGFALAVGKIETYGAAKLRVEFNKKEIAGGFFAGRTCTPSPLELVNENFASAIGNSYPFTGLYVYGEGWYPLNELIGVPSSCFFNVRGGAGTGVFFNADGPVFGGQFHYGISGEVLCLVEVQGEIDMVGFKDGSDFTFQGTGKITGEFGICPLCEEITKSVHMTVQVDLGSGDVDFDVDF